MRELEISRQSEVELIQIKGYTTINWGQQQSQKHLVGIHKTMMLLQENPHIGANKLELSEEIYSFPHASHLIYYKFNDNKLYIMAVIHKNMLPIEQLKGR
ncbi:MAG: type II toxin-antitoxin system RelE/ParE family toxin [Proteobacteria bacterium]|nr:type II toxin-antitoxin system RelE/ParE family toxin [Pseudomonadota bacterium]